jgi:hypothetical protein
MDAHVGTPRLMPSGERELVAVFPQVPKAVHVSSRAMRDDTVARITLPCRDRWRELKPCRTEILMLGLRRSGEAKDAMGNPF